MDFSNLIRKWADEANLSFEEADFLDALANLLEEVYSAGYEDGKDEPD